MNTAKPDSRLPWRVVEVEGFFEIWTREDNTPGSRNNYMIADNIQDKSEAQRLCDCHTACSGMADPAKEIAALRKALEIILACATPVSTLPWEKTPVRNMDAIAAQARAALKRAQ